MGVHKNANLKDVKVTIVAGDSTSTWLHEDIPDSSIRVYAAQNHYKSVDTYALISARGKHKEIGKTEFNLLDISKPTANLPSIEDAYGLIIVRLPTLPTLKLDVVPTFVNNARSLLSEDGRLLLI